MQLALRRIDALPSLAWCAVLSRDSETIEVRHGPGVHTWSDGWCEGAWDGPFGEAGFDRAVTFAGTGARVRAGRIVFVSGTAIGDPLCVLHCGRDVFISNSIVFAMAAAGDEPSAGVPYYEHHYFRQAREGLQGSRRSLRTRRGAATFFECANLVVGAEHRVERIEKPAPPEPRSFSDYEKLLDGAVGSVLRNAADPDRARGYRPLATVSRGYDSPALAVLASRHGCREAATFLGPPGWADDDGSEIAERLGLEAKAYPTDFAPADRCFPEAEFCVCPHGTARGYLAAEDDLRGAVLLTGCSGDRILSAAAPAAPELRYHARSGMPGSVNEFRLRVGFSVLRAYFTGWQHADAIHRISRSAEMQPWSVKGPYDRPIPRRILEEAGVPRSAFGASKMAALRGLIVRPDDLCERSRLAYDAFAQELGAPRWLELRSRVLARIDARLPRRFRRRFRARVSARWRSPVQAGYLFHWGFQHTRQRYRTD